MFCRHCGNELDNNVIVCTRCGKQVQDVKYTSSTANSLNFDGFGDRTKPKNRMMAILLCCLGFFFVGGMHKIYEGKIGLGIVYVLTGGLFWIGTIVDLINLAQTPDVYWVD